MFYLENERGKMSRAEGGMKSIGGTVCVQISTDFYQVKRCHDLCKDIKEEGKRAKFIWPMLED